MRIVLVDDFTNTFSEPRQLARLQQLGEVIVFDSPSLSDEETIRRLQGADIVLANRERTRFTRRVLEASPSLKLLSMTGSYFTTLDVEAANELGVVISTTTSSSRWGVAELTFGLMIALGRRIPQGDAALRRGEWPSLVGPEINGKTLGLLGLGKIGSLVAEIARAFRMPVIAWSSSLTPERAAALGARYVPLDELMSTADIISLHLRASPRTTGIVGAREIGLMKPTAVLINTARARLVDEKALLAALQERRIAGAGMDVFMEEPLPADHPFLALDNVVITPHVGWTTSTAQEKVANWAIDNVESYLAGKQPPMLNPGVWERRRS